MWSRWFLESLVSPLLQLGGLCKLQLKRCPFIKIVLIISFSPHDSGADSPTCSNGVTPTNKNKSHNKYTGVSSASSSPSSSPSSVNYSESNSTDSTKSQPHSATSNPETRSVLLFGLVIGFLTLSLTEKQNMWSYASKAKHIN